MINKEIKKALKEIKSTKGFEKVKFIILYGSVAEGETTRGSDIDLAIYFDGDKKEAFEFVLKIYEKLPDNFDIQIFQELPLYIQKDVLGGKVLYYKDRYFLYATAYKIIQEYEDFKPYYYDYIGMRSLI